MGNLEGMNLNNEVLLVQKTQVEDIKTSVPHQQTFRLTVFMFILTEAWWGINHVGGRGWWRAESDIR